ncbi:isopenicillin N synthase-like dioxygenase [Devosia sp. UYZn731]|uniref:isopenicillin N synthase family dioxygenase n=1 Tax=Devosia sp. UYZn731 TaxID=3156345 RepID=UPI0033941EC7
MTMKSIPLIDISPFLDGTEAGMEAVAREVKQACEEIGFFLIKGHGVDQKLIDATYHAATDFFHLPLADKLEIKQPSPQVPRGYTPFKGETLSASLGKAAPADLKEMIDLGPVDVPGGSYFEGPQAGHFFDDNLWPSKPAAFKDIMQAYYRRMNRLGNDLMSIFAYALDLPDNFFFDKLDKNISAVRLICYPEQKELPEPGQLRGGAHTDYGTLTILMSDKAAGGLQAQHRDGYWVDVVIEPGTYVVNIGDIMQIWTNDQWVSTMHRVVNPPAELADTSRRHSVVFFHQPNYDARIETLPSCYDAVHPSKYQPIAYHEHWTRKWLATKN